jgi:hypothetical protein
MNMQNLTQPTIERKPGAFLRDVMSDASEAHKVRRRLRANTHELGVVAEALAVGPWHPESIALLQKMQAHLVAERADLRERHQYLRAAAIHAAVQYGKLTSQRETATPGIVRRSPRATRRARRASRRPAARAAPASDPPPAPCSATALGAS